MPTTSVTLTNEFLSTTALLHIRRMRNMVDRPHPFLEDFMKNREDQSGGAKIIVRWKTNRHATTTRLVTGYEPINMSVLPIGTPGQDDWAYVVRPVLISKRDTTLNRGKAEIISILKERVQDTEDGLRAELHDTLLRGPGASGTYTGVPAFADFNTFNGSDSTTGFIEEAAVGSQTNVVHSVSKGTFSTLPGFQNQVFDGAGSFSTNGLPGLQSITTTIMELAPDGTKLMGYQSLANQNNLKRVLFSNERFLDKAELDAGRPVLVYNGIKLRPDSRLPNTGATTTADPWSCLILDFNATKFMGQQGMVFNFENFEKLPGHEVRAATMSIFGQVIMEYFGSSGLLFDAEIF